MNPFRCSRFKGCKKQGNGGPFDGRELKDKAPLHWQSSDTVAKNRNKRELRVWQKGTKQPVVIGRASALLSAQFLDGHEFPDRILKSFDAL